MTRRAEIAALAGAFVLCAAFLGSFLLGLRGAATPPNIGNAEPAATLPVPVPTRALGRVEVLNASGRAGLARTATDRLRTAGFDVVYYGNATGFSPDTSVVLDRTGNDAIARAAARRLGITSVRTQRDTSLYLDATVVLGRDWAGGAAPAQR